MVANRSLATMPKSLTNSISGGFDTTTIMSGYEDPVESLYSCVSSLKEIVRRVQADQIDKDALIRSLQETLNVLEQACDEETKRICGTDEELSLREGSAVPNEVRDWLASTFTRSMSRLSLHENEKRRFRSVAHVIRAGIFVDRMYRRVTGTAYQIPSHIMYTLKNVDTWNFDVFALHEASNKHSLKYVTYELLQRFDLISKFKIHYPVLDAFCLKMEEGYMKHNNPYHNLIHAADVAQTTFFFLSQSWLSVSILGSIGTKFVFVADHITSEK